MSNKGDGMMRRLTVLTGVLLSSSLLAGIAAATSGPLPGVCNLLERRVDRCQSETRPSREKRASCDRVEQGFRALCGKLETILASESAESAALDLLREDYEVVPIEDAAASVFPHHVVIGPSDLDDPDVVALLKEAHRVGKSVAIANATEEEARSFHRLLRAGQEANCAPEGSTEIELYGLQRSVTRTPSQSSSFCLLSLDDRGAAPDRRWLRDRFARTPPQPAAGQVSLTDATTFLSDLAAATHCSFKFTDNTLGRVQSDLYTYAMRNFTDTGCPTCNDPGADYYLVQDNVTFTPSETDVTYIVSIRRPSEASSGSALSEQVDFEFSDPQTVTAFVAEYTNSSSISVSGSVGISAEDGPSVTVGGSVTAGKSTSYNVPPTKILQRSDTQTAEPDWQFEPQSTTPGANFDPKTTWVWFVPRDAYPSGGTGSGQIAFSSGANIFHSGGNTDVFKTCNVPYPFSAWTVAPPQLSSLDPTSTTNGEKFTITGQFLYPGSVTAVLIGGNPVSLGNNVDLVNDTTITVTVGDVPVGVHQVQVNTEFNGENRFSNTLDLTVTD